MNKYEIGQVWTNGTTNAEITNIATSYDYAYVTYRAPEGLCETSAEAFAINYPQEHTATGAVEQKAPEASTIIETVEQ